MAATKTGEKRKSVSADTPADVDKLAAKKQKREERAKVVEEKKKKKATSWMTSRAEKARAEGKIFSRTKDRDPSMFGPNYAQKLKETTGTPSANSKEAHAKQKQLALERRAAKPLADELARAKKLWERLRRKSHVPKEERQQLVDELFGITTGRVRDFVLKHDAVRAVQTAIKYSTPDQRAGIARELQGTYAQLAESKYAKFLIGKLLVQNDEGVRAMIISEFYGKVRKLINHPEASWILDDVYRGIATKEQKARLLREWYGPEFALDNAGAADPAAAASPTADLSEILASEPSKRGTILKHLLSMINPLVQKSMTGFTMLHDAMLQYFLNVPPGSEDHKEFLELVKGDESGDLLKNMAFTKSGARLVCLLLAYGSAKDRKLLLRAYKDTFQLLSGDPHGHVVILAAYDLIDDTVLTSKAIFPEILGKNEDKEVENIVFAANDLNARTSIRYLFEGTSKALFPASHAADVAILDEIHKIREATSKKDPETRRKELVAAMSPQLLAAIAASPADLVATSFGCHLVTDVLLFAVGDKTKALEAVAQTAAGATTSPETEKEKEDVLALPTAPHVSQSLFGTRMLKTLVAGGRFDREAGCVKPVEPPLHFANILYPHIRDHIMEWATGAASSFVVVALLEAADLDGAHVAALKKTLSKKENRRALERSSTEETVEQKAKREAAEAASQDKAAADQTNKGKKDKKKNKKQAAADAPERPVGNAGAKLLLEKLA